MMVSESATVSGFILLANHRSSTYAITYDAVYSSRSPAGPLAVPCPASCPRTVFFGILPSGNQVSHVGPESELFLERPVFVVVQVIGQVARERRGFDELHSFIHSFIHSESHRCGLLSERGQPGENAVPCRISCDQKTYHANLVALPVERTEEFLGFVG